MMPCNRGKFIPIFLSPILVITCFASPNKDNVAGGQTLVDTEDEIHAASFMKQINDETSVKRFETVTKKWNYLTNINNETKQHHIDGKNSYGEFARERWNQTVQWKSKWSTFQDEFLKRQFKLYSVLGTPALPKEKFEELNRLQVEMSEIYSTGQICDYKNPSKCDLSLDPDLTNILKSSRDYDELVHVWKSWRDIFRQSRELYTEFADLLNEAALLNDFPSAAEMKMDSYESDTFEDDVKRIYKQIAPLYSQLHAYTRRKLREVYDESLVPKRGPIPAHITGNMWAQSWQNIYNLLVPYPNKTFIDVTENMIKQNYTPQLMFEKADDFFASLGLERVPDSFWNNSMIERPEDREVQCHPSAWDFGNSKDFRIKQCTKVDMTDFFTVHHEMGHVQYFLQYKDLPSVFQTGANPGFHEAVGDLISLSVSTPKHLHKVGLLDEYETDDEADINFLLKNALDKVAFLPFAYMIDKYRWDLFRGNISPENYTKGWWQNRYELQGLQPPVMRTEQDFDPAAKSHISTDVPYIRYFVSFILQFQFHKSVCLLANEYDETDPLKPLHRCDIYQSKEAGTAIKNMLKLGSSKHWRTPLRAITGSDVMDASALREYFRPLEKWLINDNNKHGEFIGWEGGYEQYIEEDTTSTNASSPTDVTRTVSEIDKYENTEEGAQIFMDDIDKESTELYYKVVSNNWNFNVNITEETKKANLASRNAYGEYAKNRWNRISEWKSLWPKFNNETLKRQFKIYSVLGTSALPKPKLEKLNEIKVQLKEIYSTSKICDYNNSSKCDLSLEPDIRDILKTSRDYDELVHVWKSWRDNFAQSKQLFTEYASLQNEAALLNDFPSGAEMWMYSYESETFEDDVKRLYNQLAPLYKQLHAYTRRKLRELYGADRVSKKGPIPAHITGNMWAQSWGNLYDLLVPYSNKTSIDVTDNMIKQGYTPQLMFEKADDFFASLGLERVSDSFWNDSMIEKPEDREVVCHASAWDFGNSKDFRIKQCTSVDMDDFFTVHHELGHIQYFMQYKDQPLVFKRGANPGFHEAIGDLMSLSVSTPKHLHKVGLLDKYETDDEADINFLLKNALDKVAFLPFAYMVDKYRWDLLRENIVPENYTKGWWEERYNLQGLKPPVLRSETDFDPAAKYHVSADVKYVRYFVAYILQFQFHKELCIRANEYDETDPLKPLHRCDIYQSKEAGTALKDLMKLGSSKHWRKQLRTLTGSDVMDASALREYFRPLEKWLIADNKKHGEFIGWEGERDFMSKGV